MQTVLINPYELGRQPFGLAEPAAWLEAAGHQVRCIDLALEKLDDEALARAHLVAIHLAMHTATRIALEALPRIRALAPGAHICCFGLYAPPNAALLAARGVGTVLGGECEPALTDLAERISAGDPGGTDPGAPATSMVSLDKIRFLPPVRTGLPPLERYASLVLADGSERTVAFAEASRGCKHLCRHCPVVPIYNGRFRVVPVDIVVGDIDQQIAAGATHVSFGDPDFLNGPTHARRVIEAFRARHPDVTYDCTIKVEHLLANPEFIALLAESGCLFVTTAVESVDETILTHLDKGHTRADFETVAHRARAAGLALAPTFVPFTPWTTLAGYRDMLATLVRLELVENVPAIQLAIRLLVPAGSRLLELDGFAALIGDFDPALLGYPWQHRDPAVDALQREVQALAEAAEAAPWTRRETFTRIWDAAHRCEGLEPAPLPADLGHAVPHHSEPWYCCAEPTSAQLQSF